MRRLPIGFMVVAGFERYPLERQLALLDQADIRCVELYPKWSDDPDPRPSREACAAYHIQVHSVHAVWGTESFSGRSIDLASLDESLRRRSVEEVRRSIGYASGVGARCLVIHPGTLSEAADAAARTVALRASLESLLPTAGEHGVRLCLENMPPGVFPGSRTADLVAIIESLDDSCLGICLDIGHAHIVSSVGEEIAAAGRHLATTHLHDNDGKRDTHRGPFSGTVPWPRVTESLLASGYQGPLILECVGWYYDHPDQLNAAHRAELERLRPAAERGLG